MSTGHGWSKWDGVAPEVIADYRAGKELADISAAHGIPQGSIGALLLRHGVPRDRRAAPPLPVADIVRIYTVEGLSIDDITTRVGHGFNYVRDALIGAGVQLRPRRAPEYRRAHR